MANIPQHRARKRFGQNFLHDDRIISEIIGAMQIKPDEHWVEIGPGLGALTNPLLQENITLDVIELDRDLIKTLQQKFKHQEKITIHNADALKFDFSTLMRGGQKLRLVGNLPYNISTPLLFHLLTYRDAIEDMYFMLQKEVVERICAQAGSKTYGRLSVMMQYHCECEFLFEVPPECFHPQPKVVSAIIRLKPYTRLPIAVRDLGLFNALVVKAFSQRRKTIRNSLASMVTEQQLIAANIDPSLRVESITLSMFAELCNMIEPLRKC